MTHAFPSEELTRKYAEAVVTSELFSFVMHELGHQVFSLCAQAGDLVNELRTEELSGPRAGAAQLFESALQLQRTLLKLRQIQSVRATAVKFPIRDIVEQVFDLLRGRLAQDGIATRIRVEPELAIHGVPEQLRLVLVNLALNSIQALCNEPCLRNRVISVDAHHLSGLSDPNSKGIEIIFTDTGPGISPSLGDPDQIFEFGTSSLKGKTGYGLPISRRAIEQSFAGTLELASARPAVFRLQLTDTEPKI